ncbi:putative nudix hydrolase 26, chloroplastic [Cocos nucifera]|uniref:Putative nudix hydrolase 26, chloroplastic n=1 Tax=Cocos nucifera TaxID=13894 RepID=A0A8K0N3Y2_COCNU|nr:putative nudix hydrolase 26, chloroplastic [Cocos nucifera]
MITMSIATMDKLSDTYGKMFRVKTSVAEELQEKVRLMERHVPTNRANTLMEAKKASWLAYELNFDEYKALI